MNRRSQRMPRRVPPSYRPALERLDEALDKNTRWDNSEKIRLLHAMMFGDEGAPYGSEPVKIPQ